MFRRATLAFLAAALLALFCFFHVMTGDTLEDAWLRVLLGIGFALAILYGNRFYGGETEDLPFSRKTLTAAVLGAVLCIVGIVFSIHQFQWIGMLGVAYGCLRWALEPQYARKIRRAVFVLYWIHPLPAQIAGPVQLAMQWLSVRGAEWLLHTLNIPVWGSGLILHNGFQAFEVPQACSGLRTVFVIVLCVLGSSLFWGFRATPATVLMVVGILQTVALNVVRIAITAALAGGRTEEWWLASLHTTTGVVLLAAIVLVQAEAVFWQQARKGKGLGWWHALWLPVRYAPVNLRKKRLAWLAAGSVLAAMLAGLAFAVSRHRTAHRAALYAEVAERARDRNLPVADEIGALLVKMVPSERAYHLRWAQTLLLRGKYAEGLRVLDAAPGKGRDDEELGLRLGALAGLDRMEEVRRLLGTLDEAQRKRPEVLVASAKLAMQEDDVPGVVAALRQAALRGAGTRWLRGFFPYLAARGQWRAISDLDRADSYDNEEHFRAALIAFSLLDRRDAAETALKNNRALWAGNPGFLKPLAAVALWLKNKRWTDEFASALKENLPNLPPDELADFFAPSFGLLRPDLAWLVYERIARLDPSDPSLALAAAEFPNRWFTFSREQLGLPVKADAATLNLLPLLRQIRGAAPWTGQTAQIPLLEEFLRDPVDAIRKQSAERCIRECQTRLAGGVVPLRLAFTEERALECEHRYEEAAAWLDRVVAEHPESKPAVWLRLAGVCHRLGDQERTYEITRQLARQMPLPEDLQLAQVDSLMRLNLGFLALDAAEAGVRRFPESRRTRESCAALLDFFGRSDEALLVLESASNAQPSPLLVHLLARNGRFREADTVRQAAGMAATAKEPHRPLVLAPAEQLTTWLSATGVERRVSSPALENPPAGKPGGASPFVADLRTLVREWRRTDGGSDASDRARWLAAGRDDEERAAALHALCSLLIRKGALDEARAALDPALKEAPASAVLWRLSVMLAAGKRSVIQEARAHCPDDSEIWLADFVTAAGEKGFSDEAAGSLMESAARSGRFPPETFLRAADFCLRKRMPNAAEAAVRHVLAGHRDDLGALDVGIRAAIQRGDRDTAFKRLSAAGELAEDPMLYLPVLVRLKMDGDAYDATLAEQLKLLAQRFPEDPEWVARLGLTYFKIDDFGRSAATFNLLLSNGVERLQPALLLYVAEALRQTDRQEEAIRVLRRVREREPGNADALNNLVYTLAGRKETLPEAAALLPELRKQEQTPALRDTIALVETRLKEASGNL